MGSYKKTLYPKERRSSVSKVKKEDRERRRRLQCRYQIHYDLIYDGGDVQFTEFYRYYWWARISAFLHVHIRSWGGSAVVEDVKFHQNWYD